METGNPAEPACHTTPGISCGVRLRSFPRLNVPARSRRPSTTAVTGPAGVGWH